jgi:protoporphyrin/coproporphyrin ferrochelatase
MKKAVLLVNLGTPKAPTYRALRVYLKQFLSDKRVINKNRILWLSLLNLALLQIIPQRSAKNYAKIWNKIDNESPLLTYTKQQVKAMQKKLGDDYAVDFAFTYDAGVPENSIANKIAKYKNCDEIIVLSLYPQYSTTTTASIEDQLEKINNTNIKLIKSYYNHKLYIDALESSINLVAKHVKDVVVSFHGLPVEYVENGDPYQSHCQATFKELQKRFKDKNLHLTFQSKFGPAEWLKPATDQYIIDLAKNGTKEIAVITPGFAVDCIETLEEISMEAKELFIEHGGERFTYIPCLNDSKNAIDIYSQLVKDIENTKDDKIK